MREGAPVALLAWAAWVVQASVGVGSARQTLKVHLRD